MNEPILKLDGKVINQLCKSCIEVHPVLASAYRLHKRTKGFCGICGHPDSWSIRYISPEEVKRNQTA
jgi:hypothetical protein